MSKVLELVYNNGPRLADDFYPDDEVEQLHFDQNPLPYKDGELRGIFTHYVLNKISWRGTVEAVRDWGRCLEPEGLLHIIVPSRRWIARAMLQEKIEPHVAPLLFGDHGGTWEFNGSLHSVSDLRAMIDNAGLACVKAKIGEVEMEVGDGTYKAEQIYVVGRKDAYMEATKEFV